MSYHLTKVPYDLDYDHDLVATTLRTKKISQDVSGIGPVSCWAGVMYYGLGSDKPQIVTGFSQQKIDLVWSPYKNQWVKYHGEIAAVAQTISTLMTSGHQSGDAFPIVCVYIEMSPCGTCGPALNGLLPDKTPVLHSFDYETEGDDWAAAAKKLCGK